MNDRAPALQDLFLNQCRRAHVPVTIFLVKGVKLVGVIAWFDNFSLLLKRDGQSQLVYKHAVSTIVPMGAVDFGGPVAAARGRGALQDLFLEAAEREAVAIRLFLVNGVMLSGRVIAHDQFVVALAREQEIQMVYKHAISTIQPEEHLDLGSADSEAEDGR